MKINGVNTTSISKINGKSLAAMSKIAGVTLPAASVQLSVYYNADAGTADAFCAGFDNTLITIYTPTYTTLATIYSNNANIYTDSGLTTLASAGYYGITNGGPFNTWYERGITSWVDTGMCPD